VNKTADSKELRSLENLRRAWRWVRSNPDATFKAYFRESKRLFDERQDSDVESLKC